MAWRITERLRALLEREARAEGVPFFAAQPQHTGDNAGMIAFAAWVDPVGCDRIERDDFARESERDSQLTTKTPLPGVADRRFAYL